MINEDAYVAGNYFTKILNSRSARLLLIVANVHSRICFIGVDLITCRPYS